VLILSELVTNALLHARQGARIGVAVTATATRIAMAVTDTPKPGRRCTYQDPDQHGRGMILVRRLAVVTETGGAGWHTVTAVIQTGEVR
jgi:anti-sigma regulatory factor (Ser/Thr protein kinase)